MRYLNILLFLLCSFPLLSQNVTEVTIRAKAKDAKFIGSSIGGALVIVRDADTGQILDQGLTTGSTGNTSKIMKEAHDRYTQLADEMAAKFVAELELERPKLITIEMLSPYTNRQAQIMASTQIWVIPGKDIMGDGVVMEIPGFIIDILEPQTHRFMAMSDLLNLSAERHKGELKIRANIVMMCGCTISKGGLWNGEKMEVEAIVFQNNKKLGTYPMNITDTVNIFEGNIPLKDTGSIEIIVTAFDPQTGNTGVDKVNFVVGK